MTTFEIMVPVIALAIALIGVIGFTIAGRRLDARLEAERQAKHPAE
ncbi:MAG: hypothetical protein ACRC14_11155 [Paracoccaceae bacterium]